MPPCTTTAISSHYKSKPSSPKPAPSSLTCSSDTCHGYLVSLSLLPLLALAAGARRYEPSEQTMALLCHLQRITTTQPSHRIHSEGGVTEVWDPSEDQFQRAGVAAMRATIQPNSLSLPKSFPAPCLIYIVQGRGILGLSCPGCAETFHSVEGSSGGRREMGGKQNQHQKLHRVRRGDVIAIPHGAAHWCYNDGNEELVAISVLDLNNRHNQLDQNLRAANRGKKGRGKDQKDLAGMNPMKPSQRSKSQSVQETFQNVFRSMDKEILAEAFNVPTEIVRRMKERTGEQESGVTEQKCALLDLMRRKKKKCTGGGGGG